MRHLLVAALLASSWGCGDGDPYDDDDGDGRPGSECDDPDRPAWIAWQEVVRDVDGDGHGDATDLCTSGTRPPGFVAEGGDCAPTDGAAWRLAAYAFVDRDRDDRTIAEAGQVCTGAALPPPYEASASGNDCDDADPALLGWVVLYGDGDHDGVGAGPRSVSCTGATLPADRSIFGDDADDEDPVIQADEEDEDELQLILS